MQALLYKPQPIYSIPSLTECAGLSINTIFKKHLPSNTILYTTLCTTVLVPPTPTALSVPPPPSPAAAVGVSLLCRAPVRVTAASTLPPAAQPGVLPPTEHATGQPAAHAPQPDAAAHRQHQQQSLQQPKGRSGQVRKGHHDGWRPTSLG